MKLHALRLFYFLILFLFLSCAHTTTPLSQVPLDQKAPAGQLPSDVDPLSYQLHLEIDPDQDHFSGTLRIDLRINKALDNFWMHGKNLEVSEALLFTHDGKTWLASYDQLTSDGVVKISLPQSVDPQTATLSIRYRAKLTNELSGLYKVVVAEKSYAFTQFEPISARACFPGFDEPRFKTPFEVTLVVPAKHVAIANTPVVKEEKRPDGKKTVFFAPTKPLPTYLIAFAVGPFDVVEGKSIAARTVQRNAIPFRAIAVEGMGKKLNYALQNTPRLVELLEEYFGIPYPYEKLDIIAVPDFGAGAMENAGAITFRDSLLLIDEKNAPVHQKRAFAYVMAHELAHQWFGNLVTMPWWNDLWLNEAFATWMETKIIEKFKPDYNADVDFLEETQHAMRQDSLMAARQIRQPILSHHDIHNAFDSITYSKGGATLAMFEEYLGKKTFQKGIRHHLNRFRFGVATAEDFVESISQIAKQDIKAPFFSFLNQAGVPWLQTELQCSDGHSRLRITQSRYLPLGSLGPRGQLWQIPVCYKYKVSNQVKQECLLIDDQETYISFNSEKCPAWLLPNANAAGYYRWGLTQSDLEKLAKPSKDLNEREQLSILDSINAGFANGKLKAADVYSMLGNFAASKNRLVATEPMSTLRFSRDYLIPVPFLENFEKYAKNLYLPALNNLRSGRSPMKSLEEKKLFEAQLYGFMAFVVRDPSIRADLRKKGRVYVNSLFDENAKPDNDLASVSVGVLVQDDESAFEELQNSLAKIKDPIKRQIVLGAIAKTVEPKQREGIYELLLSSRLRRNEVVRLFGAHMEQMPNRDHAWNWFKEHFDDLLKVLPKNQTGSLPHIASRFCSHDRAEEVRHFFEEKEIENFPGGPRELEEVLEQITLCATLVDFQKVSAVNFFRLQEL